MGTSPFHSIPRVSHGIFFPRLTCQQVIGHSNCKCETTETTSRLSSTLGTVSGDDSYESQMAPTESDGLHCFACIDQTVILDTDFLYTFRHMLFYCPNFCNRNPFLQHQKKDEKYLKTTGVENGWGKRW